LKTKEESAEKVWGNGFKLVGGSSRIVGGLEVPLLGVRRDKIEYTLLYQKMIVTEGENGEKTRKQYRHPEALCGDFLG